MNRLHFRVSNRKTYARTITTRDARFSLPGRKRLRVAWKLCPMEAILDRSAVESRFALRVYYEDTDAGGVVYYANYLRFIERARTEIGRTIGFDPSTLARDEGIAFAVRSLEVEYLRPGCLDDALTIISTVESVKSAQVIFNQRIVRGDETLFTARVRCVCVQIQRMKAAAMPQAIRDAFQALCVSRPDVVADSS
jgi:acyl-CoA thioester hydrolase